MNGRRDNPLDFVANCWAVSKAGADLTPHQADLEMLKRAVARIRGRRGGAQDDSLKFGLDAMDVWIKQMATVKAFCPECEQRMQGNPNRGGFRCAMSDR